MITFTNNTTSIRKVFPHQWDISALTGLTLQIADVDGNELMAAAAVGLYTATTLDSAASQFDDVIYLDAGAGALAIGDLIALEGINGFETHTVKGVDNSNKIVTLEETLNRAFEAGADVYRMSGLATVDFSNTTTYPAGIQLVLTWAPTGTGSPFTERAEIEAKLQVDVAAFGEDFKGAYPRAYDALSKPADRLGTILRIAQDQLRLRLYSRGLDIARVVDQRLLSPPLMALVAKIWARDGDDKMIEERKIFSEEYNSTFEDLCNLPIWVDSDGDSIQDDGEVQNYPKYFERAW